MALEVLKQHNYSLILKTQRGKEDTSASLQYCKKSRLDLLRDGSWSPIVASFSIHQGTEPTIADNLSTATQNERIKWVNSRVNQFTFAPDSSLQLGRWTISYESSPAPPVVVERMKTRYSRLKHSRNMIKI